ncbi:MAG: MFS transporter [Pseudomonadales bacterium]
MPFAARFRACSTQNSSWDFFYALGVVFALKIGLSVSEAALLMSAVVLGGLAFQLPIGAMADRYDRRVVMSGALMAVGTACSTLAGFIASELPLVALLIVALTFGGAVSSVYPLCVAQTLPAASERAAASNRIQGAAEQCCRQQHSLCKRASRFPEPCAFDSRPSARQNETATYSAK